MTRQDLYKQIKKNGWQSQIADKFGKNFTQVKSSLLEEFIKEKNVKPTSTETRVPMYSKYDKAFVKIVSTLQFKGLIDVSDADDILTILN